MRSVVTRKSQRTSSLKKSGEKVPFSINRSHSVIEVSEYLGTSTSLVYRYIRGEVLPSIDRIVALSVYLGVPIEQIIAVA